DPLKGDPMIVRSREEADRDVGPGQETDAARFDGAANGALLAKRHRPLALGHAALLPPVFGTTVGWGRAERSPQRVAFDGFKARGALSTGRLAALHRLKAGLRTEARSRKRRRSRGSRMAAAGDGSFCDQRGVRGAAGLPPRASLTGAFGAGL